MLKNNPPWKYELDQDLKFKYLSGFMNTDITIIGGGIAGCSTLFALLTQTDKNIILVEGATIASGATGHNAGYVVADFEKSIKSMVKEYGIHMTREAVKELESGWDKLDEICVTIKTDRVDKFYSVGAYTDIDRFVDDINEQIMSGEENLKTRIYLNAESEWTNALPKDIVEKINILSKKEFIAKLGVNNDVNTKIYQGIITEKAAVMNSSLFCQKIIKYCLTNFQDRFQIYENTKINKIHLLEGSIILDSEQASINSSEVILCTNGFENFKIYDRNNLEINKSFHKSVHGVIGYMLGTVTDINLSNNAGNFFSENKEEPYTYFSQRRHLDKKHNIICIGGPETELSERVIYRHDHEADEKVYTSLEEFQNKMFSINDKPIYHWHGLMGYTESGVRIIGKDSHYPELMYNLGCNGIGIIPSIVGAYRVAKLVNREVLAPSIFDPK
jgi:glycine/D-amino acid oxidase-like deaminating enzyme